MPILRPRELSSSLSLFPALTPTLPPATHTNSYALGGREVLLVEPATPYADEQRQWLAWARALRGQGRTLKALVVTHHHADHVGGLEILSRELAVPVWAHPLTASRLEPTLRERISRHLSDGDEIVLDGQAPETWRVMHTPGHAPGHLCLYETQAATLVVGDMVASVGTILIAPDDGDMALYLEQLTRLASLGARLALPSHGDPIDAPASLLRQYIAHRLAREAKVLTAVRAQGAAGARLSDLLPHAYADTPPHLWPLAILSLETHLRKLEQDGAITCDDELFFKGRIA